MQSIDPMQAGIGLATAKFWWEDATISIELNPAAETADAGTLLIGLGNAQAAMAGVCLNHKGARRPAPMSVSAFVAEADAAQWQRWQERLRDVQAVRKIVVEDFSLDTCMALLLFGNRLQQIDEDPAGLASWVSYVTAWEAGEYLDRDHMTTSPACLVTALGHSYHPEAGEEEEEQGVHIDFAAEGLRACLRLLHALRAQRPLLQSASAIAPPPGRESERALAHLRHERQMYQLSLQRAVRCQLMLTLEGSQRHVLSDALFLSETFASGVLKIMARTDTENTWTRQGFAFLGVYRPGERGSGDDMVVSVDPETSITLRDLWVRLEELETERWGGARPTDNPRRLPSYIDPADATKTIPGSPNQPWYEANGQYTLLAAPKSDGRSIPGSLLDWHKDVVPAIWDLYFMRHVRQFVQAEADDAGAAFGKRIHVVRRLAQNSATKGLKPDAVVLMAPTFHAWLASHSFAGRPAASPFELPPAGSFEMLQLGGHLAVLHRHGLTFLLREDEPASHAGLVETAQKVAQLTAEYGRFLNGYRDKLNAWSATLANHGSGSKLGKTDEWEHEIQKIKVSALTVLSNSTVLRSDYDENRLSEALQRVWGLPGQRSELADSVERIDELMRQAIRAKTERWQRIYGSIFSAFALGFTALHVWEPFKNVFTMNMYEWQLRLFKEKPEPSMAELQQIAEKVAHYEWITVAIVVGFSLLGLLLYRFLGVRGETQE